MLCGQLLHALLFQRNHNTLVLFVLETKKCSFREKEKKKTSSIFRPKPCSLFSEKQQSPPPGLQQLLEEKQAVSEKQI
jgi:hypothetical protein